MTITLTDAQAVQLRDLISQAFTLEAERARHSRRREGFTTVMSTLRTAHDLISQAIRDEEIRRELANVADSPFGLDEHCAHCGSAMTESTCSTCCP